MSTNYYLHTGEKCPTCGHEIDPIHIGKSSAGWCFLLHIYPEKGINKLEDWRKLWNKEGCYIEDEDGQDISIRSMEKKITDRSTTPWGDKIWVIGEGMRGYSSEQEFHLANHSERGPNGLARCKRRCGDEGGTWDLLKGDWE